VSNVDEQPFIVSSDSKHSDNQLDSNNALQSEAIEIKLRSRSHDKGRIRGRLES
jgi:hypothetical protein